MNASIWTADTPPTWPDAPAKMTVTALREIESCPRRWALGAACYPELWSGRGYPPRVSLSALSGTVLHLALEVITKAMVKAGCPSLQDPTALRVMRDLGGYTKVLNDCIDRTLELLASSPRAKRVLGFATRSLRAQVPELRIRAQSMLCRLRLPRVQLRSAEGGAPKARGPLTTGAFPEIELRAEQIGWKGKADLLVLSSDTCEFTDFKTGTPDEKHQFQIRVYALLWSRDGDLNPTRRLARRLILAYSTGDVEVAVPSEAELDDLEQQLVACAAAARDTLSQHPPEARPNPESCRHCDVRHMCTDYWTDQTFGRIGPALGTYGVTDVAIRITGRHGPSSWDAIVENSPVAKRGQRFLLRADNRPLSLQAGQMVRLLSVHLVQPSDPGNPSEQDSSSTVIGTMGALTEVFLLPLRRC